MTEKRDKVIVIGRQGDGTPRQRLMIEFFKRSGYEVVYRDVNSMTINGVSPDSIIIDDVFEKVST